MAGAGMTIVERIVLAVMIAGAVGALAMTFWAAAHIGS